MPTEKPKASSWEEIPLVTLCDLMNGYAFKPTDWGPFGKPIIRIQNLNGGQDFNFFRGTIPKRYEVEPGSLLFAWSGNRGTSFGPFIWLGPTGLLNQHIFKVTQKEGVDPTWFYYALDEVRQRVEREAHGAIGLVHVRKEDLLKYKVLVPGDIDEQRALAAILDTVDEAIRRTEEVIEKLKRIKAGLLHDLLTRGLDENGKLRDPIRHPEQFKDSPVGKVPKEWEVLRLCDLLSREGGHVQTGPFGSQLHASEYATSGVPVVMPQDIFADGYISLDSIARITPSRAKSLSRHLLKHNDLVFARRGDLSRCSAIHAREEGWICGTGCLLMRPPKQAVRAGWFGALYRHDLCQRQIAARAVGSTMVNVNTSLILGLVIPYLQPEEQERVEAMLAQHDNRKQSEEASLRKLTLMKQGLMQDLLTGRVRVKVPEEETRC